MGGRRRMSRRMGGRRRMSRRMMMGGMNVHIPGGHGATMSTNPGCLAAATNIVSLQSCLS